MNVNMNAIKRMCSGNDYEWLNILRRLEAYGKKSTGSKDKDKVLLHSIELEKAKQEGEVSTKFIMLTAGEKEEIRDKKREKQKEKNTSVTLDYQQSAQVLGQQLSLAIQMKNKKKK